MFMSNWNRLKATAEIRWLRWRPHMLRTQQMHLLFCRRLNCCCHRNSICVRRDLWHIPALRRHNGISLWMHLDTRTNVQTTLVAPNSRSALLPLQMKEKNTNSFQRNSSTKFMNEWVYVSEKNWDMQNRFPSILRTFDRICGLARCGFAYPRSTRVNSIFQVNFQD